MFSYFSKSSSSSSSSAAPAAAKKKDKEVINKEENVKEKEKKESWSQGIFQFASSLKFSKGAAPPPTESAKKEPVLAASSAEKVDPEISCCCQTLQKQSSERIEPCLRNLQQIAARQDDLLRIVTAANLRFAEHPDWLFMQDIMAQAPKYVAKMKQLKVQMQSLSQRSKKLTQRTAHLQARKEKADERERDLMAKPAPGVLSEQQSDQQK